MKLCWAGLSVSCQNGTYADHYQKTNDVGSGPLRYTPSGIFHYNSDGYFLLTLVVC